MNTALLAMLMTLKLGVYGPSQDTPMPLPKGLNKMWFYLSTDPLFKYDLPVSPEFGWTLEREVHEQPTPFKSRPPQYPEVYVPAYFLGLRTPIAQVKGKNVLDFSAGAKYKKRDWSGYAGISLRWGATYGNWISGRLPGYN